jgi:hypothetical protein
VRKEKVSVAFIEIVKRKIRVAYVKEQANNILRWMLPQKFE